MKNGKETTCQRNVVAADGKTRTVTTTGVDAVGQKVNSVREGIDRPPTSRHLRTVG
jgi:hypothetical protein